MLKRIKEALVILLGKQNTGSVVLTLTDVDLIDMALENEYASGFEEGEPDSLILYQGNDRYYSALQKVSAKINALRERLLFED